MTDWSQLRQNLITIERMQQETTKTYTYIMQQGVDHPVFSCDSIGLPIPATDQLTNPQVPVWEYSQGVGGVTVSQMEATGVFTGDSTGTHNICLNSKGQPFDFYWEGFVAASTQPLAWDPQSQTFKEAPGATTVEFKVGK